LDNITEYFETLSANETFGDGRVEADADLEFSSCDVGSVGVVSCVTDQSGGAAAVGQ
jgi:hypothetical protein